MKMRHSVIAATAMAIGFAAVIPVLAQNTETTETTTTTTVKKGHHRYVYYGDHDIYYAPERKLYYWKEGSTWQSGPELPVASRSYIVNGGVQIELDTDRPYDRDEWVVKHYKTKTTHRDDGDDDDR